MIEEPGMFSEGTELQPSGEEGTWLRPKMQTIEFSVDEEDTKPTDNEKRLETPDTSFDDVDTLQTEEFYYKYSKPANGPSVYGKMLPFFKKKNGEGYYIYLGPDCRTGIIRAFFSILVVACHRQLLCIRQVLHESAHPFLPNCQLSTLRRTDLLFPLAAVVQPRFGHREKNRVSRAYECLLREVRDG